MPTYLSTHIIACMTRQALNQLIATLQAAHEVTFIRASASQMVGRLVCEFEAPDQEALLRFLEEHHVAYEWIIRVELTWSGAQPSAPAAAPEALPQAQPDAPPAGQVATPTVAPPVPVEVPAAQPVTEKTGPSPFALGEASEAKILHILRSLKDECMTPCWHRRRWTCRCSPAKPMFWRAASPHPCRCSRTIRSSNWSSPVSA